MSKTSPTVLDKTMECKVCGKEFPRGPVDLARHMNAVTLRHIYSQKQTNQYNCGCFKCNTFFTNMEHLQLHKSSGACTAAKRRISLPARASKNVSTNSSGSKPKGNRGRKRKLPSDDEEEEEDEDSEEDVLDDTEYENEEDANEDNNSMTSEEQRAAVPFKVVVNSTIEGRQDRTLECMVCGKLCPRGPVDLARHINAVTLQHLQSKRYSNKYSHSCTKCGIHVTSADHLKLHKSQTTCNPNFVWCRPAGSTVLKSTLPSDMGLDSDQTSSTANTTTASAAKMQKKVTSSSEPQSVSSTSSAVQSIILPPPGPMRSKRAAAATASSLIAATSSSASTAIQAALAAAGGKAALIQSGNVSSSSEPTVDSNQTESKSKASSPQRDELPPPTSPALNVVRSGGRGRPRRIQATTEELPISSADKSANKKPVPTKNYPENNADNTEHKNAASVEPNSKEQTSIQDKVPDAEESNSRRQLKSSSGNAKYRRLNAQDDSETSSSSTAVQNSSEDKGDSSSLGHGRGRPGRRRESKDSDRNLSARRDSLSTDVKPEICDSNRRTGDSTNSDAALKIMVPEDRKAFFSIVTLLIDRRKLPHNGATVIDENNYMDFIPDKHKFTIERLQSVLLYSC